MKVSVVFDDPSLVITGDNEPFVLDLVAHFLGVAMHDNDNARPSRALAPAEPQLVCKRVYGDLPLVERVGSIQRKLDYEEQLQNACLRAVSTVTPNLRIVSPVKNRASWLFEETCCRVK